MVVLSWNTHGFVMTSLEDKEKTQQTKCLNCVIRVQPIVVFATRQPLHQCQFFSFSISIFSNLVIVLGEEINHDHFIQMEKRLRKINKNIYIS